MIETENSNFEIKTKEGDGQPYGNTFRYIKVVFDNDDVREYSYLDRNRIADFGDYVWVPAGKENKQKLALVVDVKDYSPDELPYPIERTKNILRLASDEEVAMIEANW